MHGHRLSDWPGDAMQQKQLKQAVKEMGSEIADSRGTGKEIVKHCRRGSALNLEGAAEQQREPGRNRLIHPRALATAELPG